MPRSYEKTVRVLVTGRVQGVGFRAFLTREATRLRLAGWARNRGWDQVEAVVAGESGAVAEFVGLAQRGPWGARVDSCREEPATLENCGEGFVVAPSA